MVKWPAISENKKVTAKKHLAVYLLMKILPLKITKNTPLLLVISYIQKWYMYMAYIIYIYKYTNWIQKDILTKLNKRLNKVYQLMI